MGYQLSYGTKLALDVAFTRQMVCNGLRNWLAMTPRDRELLASHGLLYEQQYDQRFYWGVDNPKQLDDEAIR